MPIRRGKPLTFRAKGLTDSIDGSNAFPGSMQSLQNLISNPTTAQQWVPRPAAVPLVQLGGYDPLLDSNGNPLLDNNGNVIFAVAGSFTAPDAVECLYVVGSRIYGMVATGRYSGKSEPFCYDFVANAFITIGNVTAVNTPNSQPTTGDWTPPQMIMISNKILITDSGYDGISTFVGWIDLSGFSYTGAATGSTHTSKTIDSLSVSVYTLGWAVGQLIQTSAADLPANTYITAISADGKTVTISNAATASNAGVTFTVTGGTKASPTYGAGQTSPIALTAVAAGVAEFNGRAYYLTNNSTQFSDSLAPLTISGAGGTFVPALILGDDTPCTVIIGVPLANQVVGGLIQSLIVFKGVDHYWQITGDPEPTPGNLLLNEVNGSTGTYAPNSLQPTPQGIAYIAPDGLRIISLSGQSSNPIGADGSGVCVPFQYAINPTRICGGYNQNVYRVTVQNGFKNGQPLEEYWYDFSLQVWSGPHTFPMALIEPVYNPVNAFVSAAAGINGFIWESTALPTASSAYIENGNQISCVWQPSLLPDNQSMAMNSSPQGALGLALPSAASVQVLALNETGTVLDSVVVANPGAGGSVWDSFNWGQATWGAPVTPFQQYTLPWHQPLVFKQGTLRAVFNATAGFVIGNAYLQYVELGYVGAAAA